MAYSKQNFQNGQILNAANLEAMENGIIAGQGAHNLLDNSDFTNPVNQRGQTSYTGAGYTIDRWKAGVSDCSMYVNAGKSVAFNTKTEGVNAYWRQYLPHSLSQLEGKTFTLAIKDAWGKTHCASGVYPTSAPSDTKSVIWINMYENVSIVLYCATNGTAFVQLTTKKSVPISWVALYEGSYTADTLPPYVPNGKHVEMLNCNVPLAPHNLLDNSDFTNPVNQRGQTSYTGTGRKVYTIDRWHTWSASISVSVQNGYLSVTNSTDSIYQNISQIIDKHNLIGKAATIAVWDANGNVYCASGLISTNNEIACTTPTDFWFSAILEDDNTIYFAIRPRGAKTATIKAAALYEGSYDASTLPAYQPKGYAAELAECQRYYRQMPYPVIPCGNNPAGTQVYGFLPFRMRIDNPTVSCDTLYFFKGDSTFCSISSASAASYGAGTRIVFNLSQSVEGNLAGAVAGNGITLNADL